MFHPLDYCSLRYENVLKPLKIDSTLGWKWTCENRRQLLHRSPLFEIRCHCQGHCILHGCHTVQSWGLQGLSAWRQVYGNQWQPASSLYQPWGQWSSFCTVSPDFIWFKESHLPFQWLNSSWLENRCCSSQQINSVWTKLKDGKYKFITFVIRKSKVSLSEMSVHHHHDEPAATFLIRKGSCRYFNLQLSTTSVDSVWVFPEPQLRGFL